MTNSTTLGDYVTFQYGKLSPKESSSESIYPIFTGYRISGYSKTYMFEEPEVVVIARGVGGTGDVKLSPPFAFITNLSIVLVPTQPLNKRYLRDYLSLANLRQLDSGAAQSMITIESLRRFPVSLPDIGTQNLIAECISHYDDLIETNRRRIALLEESARLLYREWFVKLRFPGYELVKWHDGLPEGWRFAPLSVVAAVNRASLSAKSAPDVIQYIDIASVETGVIREVTEMHFAEAPGRARRLVQHGDVIWSCVRPNRKSFALMWEPDENMVVSTGFAVLSVKTIPFSYLYLATTSDEFAAFLSNRATGAAYPAVSAKDFDAAELLVPSPEILKDFHERCEPSLCLKHNLLKQNTALAKARDELLPKLMSGAIRV